MRDGKPLAIDTQHHWLGSRYRAALAAEAERNPLFADPNAFFLAIGDDDRAAQLLERLPEMDAAGVDVAVLSIPPPAAVFSSPPAAAETIGVANDELVEACAQEPERFVALAALPLPHLDESLAELERLSAFSAIRGVCLGVDALGYAPDKAALEPLLDRIAAQSYVLVVHPAGRHAGPNGTFEDFVLWSAVETMVWTSVVGLRFALSGLLDRFPTLDVVVPHLGGVLPYLTQRLVEQSVGNADRELSHYFTERFYYDNCSFHAPALRCAVDTVGAARIMLGSDYPFRGELRRCVDDVVQSDFSDLQKQAMVGGTAARWFTPPASRSDGV